MLETERREASAAREAQARAEFASQARLCKLAPCSLPSIGAKGYLILEVGVGGDPLVRVLRVVCFAKCALHDLMPGVWKEVERPCIHRGPQHLLKYPTLSSK